MATKQKDETFFQKEKRLKARRQTYKETYRKGLFYMAYERLKGYIDQPNVFIRIHSSGELDDGTAFIQITLEGFTPSEKGI